MRNRTRVGVGLLAIPWMSLVGCSASDEAAHSEVAPEPTATTSAKLLASVEIETGHSVNFYELEGGGLTVFERAPGRDTKFVLNDALKSKSPAEIYAAVAPSGATPPAALVEAEQRFASLTAQALNAEPADKPSALPVTSSKTEAPAYYHGDEQQWFDANFCHLNYTHECLPFGRGTLATNWWPGKVGFAAGFANYAGGATFNMYWFEFNPIHIFSLHLNAGEAWYQFAFYPGTYTYYTTNIIHDEPRHAEASSYLTIATDIP